MSKVTHSIFLLSVFQLVAMDPTSPRLCRDTHHAIAPEEQRRMDSDKMDKVPSDYKKRVGAKIIGVANILNQGVMAQVNKNTDEAEGKERKIWVRKESMGRIQVSPPKSPSITHVLQIQDIDEAHVLALTCFTHPKDDTTYVVKQGKEGVLVHEVTAQDLPSHGPQSTGSNLDMDPKK